MVERVYSPFQQEHVGEEFQGRHTIRTGSQVDGGVYYSGIDGSEAIVVDFDAYHGLQDIYQEAVQRYEREHGPVDEEVVAHELAKTVGRTVADRMVYDAEYVDETATAHDGKKLDLQSFYVQEGRGVCRHMALATAAVLERMHLAGVLPGTGIINRNHDDEREAGHMWAEYVEDNRRLVLDPANQVAAGPDAGRWDYQGELGVADIAPELLR